MCGALASCQKSGAPRSDAGSSAPSGPSAVAATPTTSERGRLVAFDLVRDRAACTFGHRGALLDFGEPGLVLRGSAGESLAPERLEHEGASLARLREKSVTASFYVGAAVGEAVPTSVALRLRPAAARQVVVTLNGKPLGAVKLERGAAEVQVLRANSPLLAPGQNELSLRFVAGPKTDRDVMADVDWAYVMAGDLDRTVFAPTFRDVVVDRPMGGTIRKAVALREGDLARCTAYAPAGGSLEVELAAEGGGDVEVEARFVRDRAVPLVLGRVTATAAAKRHSFPLGPEAALGALELTVVRAGKAARALFGEPRLVAPPPLPPPPTTFESALVVVFGTAEPRSLVPFGGALGAAGLAALARDGATFTSHRATSTLASATVGAMLTGTGPRRLRLEDAAARLPTGVTTLADAARSAGFLTAFFTANPLTGSAFGFGRSWETYKSIPPEVDVAGTRPFEEAIAWLAAKKRERAVLVVHARGGHPPWSASEAAQKTLAPEGYSGGLEPRHAAELMAKARRVPPQLRFSDADRARAFALYADAVAEQDRALARLLAALKETGRDASTLVVFVGDVGVNSAASVPFGDGEPPTELLLATPLVVRGSGRFPAGAKVGAPTTDVDLATTILAALGLAPPAAFEGLDLAAVAASPGLAAGRPRFASVLGRHSLRWGNFVLEAGDRRRSLCDVALEPVCATDVRPTHPLASFALEGKLAEQLRPQGAGAAEREPAPLDAPTLAALRAFGFP